jgi:hypothetical protein
MNEGLATQSFDVPALADDTLLQVAERAEKRIEAVNKIKMLALRVTNQHDWVDQGGKPYLQASGGEKVARLFGISWTISEPIFETDEGGHFSYTYKGTFTLSGASIEAVGTRSSKDPFFKKYSYPKDENGNGVKTELPPSEIDKGDLKKAAFTNLIGNGITRLLGIRNLTWDDLQAANITKDGVNKVGYKKSGKQQEEIKSEGALTVNFIPSEVFVTNGKTKANKPFTKYTVKGPDGEYNTFSETFAKKAQEAKSCNELITVTYKVSKFGNDIENLTDAVYTKEEAEDVPL